MMAVSKSLVGYYIPMGVIVALIMTTVCKRPKFGFALLGRASFDAHQLLE